MPRPSHKPVRTCLGCNRRDAQAAMIRVAIGNDGLALDPKRRMAGRGGYLHRDADCVAGFARSKAREFRSLRCAVAFDQRRRIANMIAELIESAAGERRRAELR